jgi:hypothetical protein
MDFFDNMNIFNNSGMFDDIDVIGQLNLETSVLNDIQESGIDMYIGDMSAISTDNNPELQQPPVSICFPKGTPVTTNQGNIAIEKLNPNIHTIHNKRIIAITKTTTTDNYIISIEKNALGNDVPCATTQISKNHEVLYKGKMIKADYLVILCAGVKRIPYNGETLYNVLMEEHNNMMINNLICETLHPTNIMAKIYSGKYNINVQIKLCNEITKIFKRRDVRAYKQLYARLK